MDAFEGLNILADWFDQQDEKNRNDNHEVQSDLRRWAKDFSELKNENEELRRRLARKTEEYFSRK